MGRLTERLVVARRAIDRLNELAGKASLPAIERDALLQRFEYSEIAARVPGHAAVLGVWLVAMTRQAS